MLTLATKSSEFCRGGGIGRRVRLRGVWLTRVSSSLILDTKSVVTFVTTFFHAVF